MNATESIKTVSSANSTISAVNKEVIVYTENYHMQNISEHIINLYNQIHEYISNLDNVEIKVTKLYIAFTVNGSNFTDIVMLKKGLKLFFNMKQGTLDDPYKLTRDVSNTGHWGNGDYELNISNADKLDYVLSLIKQAYKSKV